MKCLADGIIFSISYALLTTSAAAQGIRGKVAEIDIAVSVPNALIVVIDTGGIAEAATVSDSTGQFEVRLPAGDYTIRVSHPNYISRAAEIRIPQRAIVEVRVNLRPLVDIRLADIVIIGRRVESRKEREFREFLARRDLPWGKWVDRRRIEELRAGTIDDVLRLEPGRRAPCPNIYFDGRRASAYVLTTPLDWVFGIEVYSDYYDTPLRYRNPLKWRCGAILIWTTEAARIASR